MYYAFNIFCRNHALEPITQLLLTLRFFASGDFLIAVSDFAGVHKSTASRTIHSVSRAIASLSTHYICFPNNANEINQLKQEFFNIAQFPKVGVIDCTHIRIQSPGK